MRNYYMTNCRYLTYTPSLKNVFVLFKLRSERVNLITFLLLCLSVLLSVCLLASVLGKCVKVGEGVYGEVFKTVNTRSQQLALKVQYNVCSSQSFDSRWLWTSWPLYYLEPKGLNVFLHCSYVLMPALGNWLAAWFEVVEVQYNFGLW